MACGAVQYSTAHVDNAFNSHKYPFGIEKCPKKCSCRSKFNTGHTQLARILPHQKTFAHKRMAFKLRRVVFSKGRKSSNLSIFQSTSLKSKGKCQKDLVLL